jgi:hypothetical protein
LGWRWLGGEIQNSKVRKVGWWGGRVELRIQNSERRGGGGGVRVEVRIQNSGEPIAKCARSLSFDGR